MESTTENKKKISNKLYRDSHKEYFRDYHKKYYTKNSKTIKAKIKEWRRKRLKTNPIYKMVNNLRSRLTKALKTQYTSKNIKTIDLLGASQEFVWKYLESKFAAGMSWENHGVKGWHIDHIKPCSSFDLTDPEEQKKCFHYTNLQPLWWKENLEKSNKK